MLKISLWILILICSILLLILSATMISLVLGYLDVDPDQSSPFKGNFATYFGFIILGFILIRGIRFSLKKLRQSD